MTYLVPTSRIAREIDGLFHGFLNFPSLRTDTSCDFMPRVNIRETKDDVSLSFELPGMEKKDIKVLVQDGVLTVSGERSFRSESNDDGYVRAEIRSGSFSRSFTLPDSVDNDKISADYQNGMLEIKLAKKEEAKPKQVEVKVN
ncbi:MAG TPA: Hsp20/alpha crystallin family protein [Candidatus Deferrimicrobium sp.]|nr:Hsp20/alpha crystallin family protein [Candidatus Deferrimicrobium sp.]